MNKLDITLAVAHSKETLRHNTKNFMRNVAKHRSYVLLNLKLKNTCEFNQIKHFLFYIILYKKSKINFTII